MKRSATKKTAVLAVVATPETSSPTIPFTTEDDALNRIATSIDSFKAVLGVADKLPGEVIGSAMEPHTRELLGIVDELRARQTGGAR
jgi:hypothetical protein